MTSTALGARAEKAQNITFISDAHERSPVSGRLPSGTLLLPWY